MRKNQHISKITLLHYVKLALRSLLFLAVFFTYIFDKTALLSRHFVLSIAVWVFFVVEMLLRFFPSRFESMGCQKQFERNYRPVPDENAKPVNQSWKKTATMVLIWLASSAVVGVLYFTHLIDATVVILICLGFSVCDVICILFFCPFQTWFMKNQCCTTCRIYNWDYIMIFTPLLFIPSWYTYSLFGFAFALFLRWEIGYRLHPEYFSAKTNCSLHCENCQEKLCRQKKQLRSFLKKYKDRFFK